MTYENTPYDLFHGLFNYDPVTGLLTNKVHRGSRSHKGAEAGTLNGNGYRYVRADDVQYLAHRVIWCMLTGDFPQHEIDHNNGIKDDNREHNLKDTTHVLNMQNLKLDKRNKSGFKGVSWSKKLNKWQVTACINGKQSHLGYFTDVQDAAKARVKWEKTTKGWTNNTRKAGM